MSWECGAPLWAWCCCERGMNCGMRWKEPERWPREGPDEFATGTWVIRNGSSGRDDLHVVSRATTGTSEGAGSVGAHGAVRAVPDADAGAGEGIAAIDASDAGRRRAIAGAPGGVRGAREEIGAVDLDAFVRAGGDGSVRAVYKLCGTAAGAAGTGGFRRVESTGVIDFPRCLLERMADDDFVNRSAGAGDPGRVRGGDAAAADKARVSAGGDAGGFVRGAVCGGDAGAGFGNGIPEGGGSGGAERRDDLRRCFPDGGPDAGGRNGDRRRVRVRAFAGRAGRGAGRRHCVRAICAHYREGCRECARVRQQPDRQREYWAKPDGILREL